mmetsp:Transcript_31287/g.66582  ORF Transcript_31287/g.66582 Transcript_31287/m.66582 type:complete len:97 (+) Transcript_31287:196-486(+)
MDRGLPFRFYQTYLNLRYGENSSFGKNLHRDPKLAQMRSCAWRLGSVTLSWLAESLDIFSSFFTMQWLLPNRWSKMVLFKFKHDTMLQLYVNCRAG